MNLYEITKEALDLAQILETEELTPELEQALILNQQQLQTKAGGYAKIIANYQANVDAAEAEIKRLKEYKELQAPLVLRVHKVQLVQQVHRDRQVLCLRVQLIKHCVMMVHLGLRIV